MNRIILFSLCIVFSLFDYSLSDPLLTSWVRCTGYGLGNGSAVLANVQKIMYSSDYVYVYASGVPGYSIGPWNANPNSATDQKNVIKKNKNLILIF
jgi:hypothetical protein